VDALSTQGGAASGLEIEDAALQNEHLGNPGSVRVTAGEYVRVNVEIPNKSPAQTFMVHTSLTPP
jgi:Leu/Phe-tRNA-protein transferase